MPHELMDEGTYQADFVEAECQSRGENKTPFIVLTFQVKAVAAHEDWKSIEPVYRDVSFPLTEKAWPFSEERLRKLGFNGDFRNPDIAEHWQRGINLQCKHRQGRNDVFEDWSIPAIEGGSSSEPLSDADLRRFTARWKGNNPTRTAPPASSPLPATSEPGEAQTANDLPF